MHLLDGIRVIDCGAIMQGPMTGAVLSDLGADVIKIESVDSRDPVRTVRQQWGVDLLQRRGDSEIHLGFEAVNRGKRAIALDLKSSQGHSILSALVARSDVFVHNWSPRVAEQLRIDYPSIYRDNPAIVYLDSTAYGSSGPLGSTPAVDAETIAFAGFMYLASANATEPQWPVGAIGDCAAGLMGAVGVLAALLSRTQTGLGQQLETSQLGTLMWLQSLPVLAATVAGIQMTRPRREEEPNPIFNLYCCGDGKWIVISEWMLDKRLSAFYDAIGRPDLLSDPRFGTREAVLANHRTLIEVLDSVFASAPSALWLQRLQGARILAGPVHTTLEAVAEAQLNANGYLQHYSHATFGDVAVAALPIKQAGTPVTVPGQAPAWGQDTVSILEELGYDGAGISELLHQGVVGTPTPPLEIPPAQPDQP
jgi:crotonobetainyl-CoA:carnitine CoA-transferase CaiB-like acyl-CoA transferase